MTIALRSSNLENATIKRVQIDLPEKSLGRLQDLKVKTEATSYAEVMKNALKMYEAVIEATENGGSFFVQTATGETKKLVFF